MMAGGDARFHNDGKWMRLGAESCVSMLLLKMLVLSAQSPNSMICKASSSAHLWQFWWQAHRSCQRSLLGDLRWFWQVACPEKYEILLWSQQGLPLWGWCGHWGVLTIMATCWSHLIMQLGNLLCSTFWGRAIYFSLFFWFLLFRCSGFSAFLLLCCSTCPLFLLFLDPKETPKKF